jgi:putative ABC transport system ATP-binding protein
MAVESLYVEPEKDAAEVEWPALECIDVFKIFRSGPVETVALRGLDVRVERGELVAVLGPSGCGKSTLLALAAGLDEPSAGEVRVRGRSLGRLDENELAEYRARSAAIVFQSDNLWPALSAQENVATGLRLAGLADAEEAAHAALEQFGLGGRGSHRASALSGGEQQRVAIARAFANSPKILFADEPTGNLDNVTGHRIFELLQSLNSDGGSTIVLVTHDSSLASRASRTIRLLDGAVVEDTGADTGSAA